MTTIFTLNARDSVRLPLYREILGNSSERMFRTIQQLHRETVKILNRKGIEYESLKSALIPSPEKIEVGFIFDSMQADSSSYGNEAMQQVLSLLDDRSSHSLLHGDLLGNPSIADKAISSHLVVRKTFKLFHPSQLYCIYLNNLSVAAFEKLRIGLLEYSAYVGYIPAKYSSFGKYYLSTTLSSVLIKHKDKILAAHEDDRPNSQDHNLTPYSLESHCKHFRSLQSANFETLLSYKIERPVSPIDSDDASLSLNSISPTIIPLQGLDVVIEDKKFEYLLKEKGGKFTKAGLGAISKDQLVAIVKSKISSNYIYCLSILEEYKVLKFNILLEIPGVGDRFPEKLLGAFEYRPSDSALRLITMY